jgi:hypothetical protein
LQSPAFLFLLTGTSGVTGRRSNRLRHSRVIGTKPFTVSHENRYNTLKILAVILF